MVGCAVRRGFHLTKKLSYKRNTEFSWQDPLKSELQLSGEETDAMTSFRDYCTSKLMPRILTGNQQEMFDGSIMQDFGERGILGCTIQGYGCRGLSNTSYGLLCREAERVDSVFRSAISIQSSLVMHPIYIYGSEEQKNKYLPGLAKGKLVGGFGLTEPKCGFDISSIQSKIKFSREHNSLVLNGCKIGVTTAPTADLYLIWAHDEEDDKKLKCVMIDKKAKGLTISAIHNQFPLSDCEVGVLNMDDVVISESNILPKAIGFRTAFDCLSGMQLGIAWGALGIAEYCLSVARSHSLQKLLFKRSLASYQSIQKKLADMATEISLGLQACLHVSRLEDAEEATPEIITMVTRNNCVKVLKIASDTRQILAGHGTIEEIHVSRHVTNLESIKTYTGPIDNIALFLGKAITGVNTFY